MAQSVVGIFNLACSAIGTRARIASPTEVSREAEVCADWYEVVRDRVFQMAPWPEASAVARLTLASSRDDTLDWTSTDPHPGYFYQYALPSDYLRPRYLSGYAQFQLGMGASNNMGLMTQVEEAVLFYTKRQEDPTKWSPQLYLAIAYILAGYISMPLHGKSGRAQMVLGQANQLIIEARETAANWDNYFLDSVPDWISARGYGGSYPSYRYFYPNAPLMTMSDLPPVIR